MEQLPITITSQVSKLSVSDLAQLILAEYPNINRSIAYVWASRLKKRYLTS
jgi:hypothetical protein